MAVPPFDIRQPKSLEQDAALAVTVLQSFNNGGAPFTQNDAARVIQTIERLYEVVADLYALGLMVEEMGEAQQLIGKWLRFGADHARSDGETARAMLPTELGDVVASIDFAMLDGIASAKDIVDRGEAKLARLLDPACRDDEGRRLAPEPRGRL